MPPDFLEELADLEVPPPPAEFGRELHQRVNRSLILVQLIELACGAFPPAMLELGRALVAALRFTLTGKYEPTPTKKPSE